MAAVYRKQDLPTPTTADCGWREAPSIPPLSAATRINLMQELHDLFTSNQFIPHGHCYLWIPGLVWLHILSDSLIALAYYSIPVLLVYIVRKRGDLPFDWIFLLFGTFIIACGTGHILDVWTLWHPTYWLSGIVKAMTAAVSLATGAVLVSLTPKILALPSPAQLEAANQALTNEIKERRRIEEMLYLVLDNIPELIFWKDRNSVYQGCNLNFARAAGLNTPEEVIGKTDYELPRMREKSDFFRQCDVRVMATDTPEYHIIETQVRADGTQTWVDTNKVPLHDAEGNVVGILSTYEDITARQLAEAQLEKALQQLTFHVENSPLAVVEWDKDFRLQRWSKQAEKIFGWKAEEVIGLYPSEWQFLVEEDQESLSRVMSALLKGKEPRNVCQNRSYTKDKRVVHCEWYNSALLDESGNLVSILSLILDVTERELASSALRQSETQLRQKAQQLELLNRLANQIRSSLDLDTILQTTVQEIRNLLQIERCQFAWYLPDAEQPAWKVVQEAKNPALRSQIGVYRAAAVGSLPEKLLKQDILGADDVHKLNVPVLQQFLFQLGYASVVGLPVDTRTGEIGVVVCGDCSGSRSWSEGEVELLRAVTDQLAIAINQADLYAQSQDAATRATAQATQLEKTLNELQQTQAQLIQSEKMSSLGQLVGGVAHEINNPVNFIYGNLIHASEYAKDLLHLLDLYQKHYPQPSAEILELVEDMDLDFLRQDLLKILSSMKVGSERIRQIVLSLRNFSRVDEADVKYVNIHEGIDSTLLILQNRLKEKATHPAIKVIKEYGNLPLVECYAGQLNQVFMNILTNAIDALEERLRFERLKVAPSGELKVEGWFVEGSEELKVEKLNVEGSKQPSKEQPANLQPYMQQPANPCIRIRTEVLECDRVVIRIADNGCGMTEEVRHKLFDPFFTTKPVGRGTGLGLSITYQIVVQRHGGVLRCHSAPGQGAELAIEIPVRQQHRQTA